MRNINRWLELLTEGTETQWSDPKNMADWANYLVFDILGELCYGRSFNLKEPGSNELKYIPKLISDYVKLQHPVSFFLFIFI